MISNYSWKRCTRIRPSSNSVKRLDMDSKSKRRMRKSELKKKSSLSNLRESKKTSRSNKTNLPKKLPKAVMTSLSIRSWSMRPRLSQSS